MLRIINKLYFELVIGYDLLGCLTSSNTKPSVEVPFSWSLQSWNCANGMDTFSPTKRVRFLLILTPTLLFIY